MAEKIPFMQMTKEQWEYAKPYLINKFGYKLDWFNLDKYPKNNYIGLDLGYELGTISNYSCEAIKHPHRYEVKDLDEFLTKAAELKGCVYKKGSKIPESIYKVGNQVRVKSKYDYKCNSSYYTAGFMYEMLRNYGGKIVTIISVKPIEESRKKVLNKELFTYRIKEDNGYWEWSAEMFEEKIQNFVTDKSIPFIFD